MSEHHPHSGNRREDRRLITGRGQYTADQNLPGQLHAYFLRSDRAHAEILRVDTDTARAMPGVHAVYTGQDAIDAGYTQFQNILTMPGRDGQPIRRPERPVLCATRVRHVGDAVALVVADTPAQAQDAAEAIEIDYRELVPVVDPEAALEPGAPQLHENIPGNLCFDWDTGDDAAVTAAFAQAAHVTRLKVRSTRVLPNPMELRSCLVQFQPADGSYDIYTCAQGMNALRMLISFTTGVPEEKIRIHVRDVGGSFGQRSPVYPEHAALMIAAQRLGRPVKWVSTRSEGFLTDTHGRAIVVEGELALDKDAKFLGARFNFVCDMGAYLVFAGSGSHVRNPAVCMTGVYRIPTLYGRFRLAMTTTTPVAPYRGAGRPDMAYAIERLVTQAALELGMDPVEIRRRNFIPPDAFPYKAPTGGVYDACNFAPVMERALELGEWSAFAGRRDTAKKLGRLRGIGLSTVIENTGAGLFPKDQVALTFDPDGNVNVYSVAHSSGQGHETTFAMIVADALGIPEEKVTVRESVVDRPLIGNHTGGSRSLAGAGSVCRIAALKAIEQIKAVAAVDLAVEPSQVDYAHGRFTARDTTRSVTFAELAARHAGRKPSPLDVLAEGSVGSTFPNGCHVAEVEIDPETGVTQIARYTAVDDTGTVISHSIVEGQVHGAVAQGIGQILGEEGTYDPQSGQLLTGSFMDYYMPRAGLLRAINVDEVALPTKLNVLGAKGVGEAGCGGSMPAVANAIMNALAPLGIHHLDMPLTPNKLWKAIQTAKTRQ
jgi:carbon-monoxide dehydrogenase large subunit